MVIIFSFRLRYLPFFCAPDTCDKRYMSKQHEITSQMIGFLIYVIYVTTFRDVQAPNNLTVSHTENQRLDIMNL